MSFKTQTTELRADKPFAGKGQLNDRLRFDTSTAAVSGVNVLTYDTTTGTFAWTNPDTAGVDTLYTADGTISEERNVVVSDILHFYKGAGDDWFLIQPGSEFSGGIRREDYYNTNSHLDLGLVLGSTARLQSGSGGASIEVDPEDPSVYYTTARTSYVDVDSLSTVNLYGERTGSVNSEVTNEYGSLTLSHEGLEFQSTALLDYNSANTFGHTFLQIANNSIGLGYYRDQTLYTTTGSFGEGEFSIGDNKAYLTHDALNGAGIVTISGTSSMRDEFGIETSNSDINLNLYTDLDLPTLVRRVDGVETHKINFAPESIQIIQTSIAADTGSEVHFQATNDAAVATSITLVQNSSDGTAISDSSINLYTSSHDGRVNSITCASDNTTFQVSGTATTPALVTFTSTTQGILLPRMTTTERDAIASPVAGLLIYNTTTNKLNIYTTAWEAVTSV